MEPDWLEHAIWWHVLPLSFVGAEGDSAGVEITHRLGRIVDWFDYAVELGASGVALGPVFASGTHGYDTTDHFRIDPRLGDDTDFRVLLATAPDRGLRVLLDGVFNHVGREFPTFVAAEAGGPQAAWFRREQDGGWTRFDGHEMSVALNHDEPAVADHVRVSPKGVVTKLATMDLVQCGEVPRPTGRTRPVSTIPATPAETTGEILLTWGPEGPVVTAPDQAAIPALELFAMRRVPGDPRAVELPGEVRYRIGSAHRRWPGAVYLHRLQ